jgi:hypothetical protein
MKRRAPGEMVSRFRLGWTPELVEAARKGARRRSTLTQSSLSLWIGGIARQWKYRKRWLRISFRTLKTIM